ncbi:MAG: hypothetical protein Q9208_008530 [Pyrenodesmia sp. 3 TL-2023]
MPEAKDEQQPKCQRCNKAGLACGGFAHPLKIIFDPTCYTVSTKLREREGAVDGFQSRFMPAACQGPTNYTDVGPASTRLDVAPTSFQPPTELDLSAFEESIQATFLAVNYLSKLEFGRKAIVERKRTFLEQSDWLVIPWELDQEPRPHLEKLFDIYCRLPGLLEDRLRLSVQKQKLAQAIMDNRYGPQPTLQEAYESVASALVSRCDDCLHQLRVWKSAWDLQNDLGTFPKASYNTPAGKGYPHEVLGPPLTFRNLSQANQYAIFNSIVIIILSIAYEVNYESLPLSTDIRTNAINESLFLKPGLVPPSTQHDHLLDQRRESAVEVCRSAPYHYLVEQHGYGGAYVMMFPLITALQVLEPGGQKSRYIVGILPCFTGMMDSKGLQGISPGTQSVNLAHMRSKQGAIRSL